MSLDAYTSVMGWKFGDDGCRMLRLQFRQGPLFAKMVRKDDRAVVRYFGSNGIVLAILGYDERGSWACDAWGRPLELDADILDEFALTTKLFSNDLSSLAETPYNGATFVDDAIDASTLTVPNVAWLDLFLWKNGYLAGTLMRLRSRAVRLLPAARAELTAGRWLHTRWLRDNEDPIEIEKALLGACVYDAEVRRVARSL